MSKIKYLGDWPEEARAAVKPSLAGLDWLVPGWCNQVSLRWAPVADDEGNQTASASTEVCYEYRWATIYVRPCFLSDPPADRRSVLIHELLHVFTGPIIEYAEQMVDRLLKEEAPKFHAATREELRVRNEGATEDLALAILSRERSETAIRIEAKSPTGPWAEPVRP